jgi:hypothetical protein
MKGREGKKRKERKEGIGMERKEKERMMQKQKGGRKRGREG